MKLTRIVLSDLHLVDGTRPGESNPLEDFFHDDRFSELLAHYRPRDGEESECELIFNGDIFDLLKVRVGGVFPTEITEEVAIEKLRACLDGHPVFVRALADFLGHHGSRLTYVPGNHDLEFFFPGVQALFRRYVAPGDAAERVRFITGSDTYYLPEGIQVRHGHQFERIHRVDPKSMFERRGDRQVLKLPWGSLWILEVLMPLKLKRTHIDRVQPLSRFLWASVFLDPGFIIRFFWHSSFYFLKYRVFRLRAWSDRMKAIPRLLRDELLALTAGFDEHAIQALNKMRGAHTLIIGHSHGPRFVQLPNGKTLVNTGTWVKMVNLDLKHLGQDSGLTYALIDYDDEGKPRTRLMRWFGAQQACEAVPYAD